MKTRPVHNSIIAQVDYLRSDKKVAATRQNIISAKLLNSRRMLTRFRNTRKDSFLYDLILYRQNSINSLESEIPGCLISKDIFLIEARSARHYWEALRYICKQDPEWKRRYPGASDPLNEALNIGYTYLHQICKKALQDAGVECSLGLIHSPSHDDALVFDYMELYRHVVVDSVIIPLFSRKRNVRIHGGKAIIHIQRKLQKCYVYHGQLVPLASIIRKEAFLLKSAMINNREWRPFRFQWGNSMRTQLPSELKKKEKPVCNSKSALDTNP